MARHRKRETDRQWFLRLHKSSVPIKAQMDFMLRAKTEELYELSRLWLMGKEKEAYSLHSAICARPVFFDHKVLLNWS